MNGSQGNGSLLSGSNQFLIGLSARVDCQIRRFSRSMPYAVVATVTAGTLLLNAVFRSSAGMDVIYILPLWLSVHLLGVKKSLVVAGFISLVETVSTSNHFALTSLTIAEGFGFRLVGFSLITCLIARFEQSFTRVSFMAYRDQLTGLLNRNGLSDSGERLRGSHRLGNTIVALDCDGLKGVNDQYGHSAGDHILIMLARILETETREADSLVRMGGDEFVLILDSASISEANAVLERVQKKFEQSVSDAGYDCSISFGIAEPQEDEELDQVLAKADQAMYSQKKSKNRSAYLS